jgi:hypothetical protein
MDELTQTWIEESTYGKDEIVFIEEKPLKSVLVMRKG